MNGKIETSFLEYSRTDSDIEGIARLDAAFFINPEWASEISTFVCLNPIFKPFLKYAGFAPRSVIPEELKTVKQMLMYYVSYAGVRTSYGSQVFEWAKKGQFSKMTEKKRDIIKRVSELDEITEKSVLLELNIKDVGEGAISFVLDHYFHDENITYPKIEYFKKV